MLSELIIKHILDRNKLLHKRHAGKRGFILATGPSIKQQDLTPLQDEVCISLSNFFVHPDYPVIAPKYHCMAPFCHPNTEEAWDAWMQSLADALREKNPRGELLFPLHDIKRNGRITALSEREIFYMEMGAGVELAEIGVDLTRATMTPQSIPVQALQAALYMGFSEIYLIGCDHDWIMTLHKDNHFYEEKEHAVARALGEHKCWEGIDIEAIGRSYVNLWQQYKLLRHIAAQQGTTIYNATKGGLLDVFPRVEYESLVERRGVSMAGSVRAAEAPAQPAQDLYDTAYTYGWQNPGLKELVYLCYKTPDFADNARRFCASPELREALQMLSRLGKGPGPQVKVLDVGCGNGIASYALSLAGYSVTATDSSTGEVAGINAARKLVGVDGAHFEIVHAAGEKSPFPDDSFDVVWMREVLHHMKDLPAFLSEMRRVLKPGGVICCLRDVVIWNESQREHFFATHPFYPITKDEGCFYLEEYLDGFAKGGLEMVEVLHPAASVINTYPAPHVPGETFDADAARRRGAGYDLFSFFARKAGVRDQGSGIRETFESENVTETETSEFAARFPKVTFGSNLQMIGLANMAIGEGSCIADNAWMNVCTRDDQVRMRIGRCVLVGRQGVVSTAGYLEIGDYCVFAPRVYVSDADHVFADVTQPVLQQGVTDGRSVVIEENCWLGINTVVSGNLTVGRGSVVGANSVVTKDVPPFSVVVGIPARVVKMFNPETGAWEKADTREAQERIAQARQRSPLPGREEYRRILAARAAFSEVNPIVAGNNINI